ncbi:MAG TPA: MHYT domain-containing protein [Vicinamibacterales bacterium]|jgi:NO-binding membrane sensor protein with MHYT domain|nr:MHYT domain-containing protein [Vicinamibacterales bacterium]
MNAADAAIVGRYDYRLVALSIVVAVMASYTAVDLGGRVAASRGWGRLGWLGGGGAAMGFGIWSMHYVGMVAFRLPVPVRYHWPTAMLSYAIAFVASVAALVLVSRREVGVGRVVAGSGFMGAAIAGLHYVAMASMRLQAMHHYSAALVTLSVAFAVVFSLIALQLAFLVRELGKKAAKAAEFPACAFAAVARFALFADRSMAIDYRLVI